MGDTHTPLVWKIQYDHKKRKHDIKIFIWMKYEFYFISIACFTMSYGSIRIALNIFFHAVYSAATIIQENATSRVSWILSADGARVWRQLCIILQNGYGIAGMCRTSHTRENWSRACIFGTHIPFPFFYLVVNNKGHILKRLIIKQIV